MNSDEYNALNPWQQVNYLHCEQCDEWYDCRDLSTALWHHEHVHRPDVQAPRGINHARLFAVGSILSSMRASGIQKQEVESLFNEWHAALPPDAQKQLSAFRRDQLMLVDAVGYGGLAAVRQMALDM